MQVNVIMFGQIAEITGVTNFVLDDVADSDQLIRKLNSQYPRLMSSKYAVAVNRKIISDNTRLDDACEVALLPPFSGG
jgi:molybdopterin synthase sulfur carrier subunit